MIMDAIIIELCRVCLLMYGVLRIKFQVDCHVMQNKSSCLLVMYNKTEKSHLDAQVKLGGNK